MSEGNIFDTFSACFGDFIPSVFFLDFLDFDAIWGSVKHNFSDNTVLEIALKKGFPNMETPPINMSRSSQRARFARALLKQDTTVRTRNVIQIRFHCPFFQKNARTCCFSSLKLQLFQKSVRIYGKSRCQKHIIHDVTRPWPRPGNFY